MHYHVSDQDLSKLRQQANHQGETNAGSELSRPAISGARPGILRMPQLRPAPLRPRRLEKDRRLFPRLRTHPSPQVGLTATTPSHPTPSRSFPPRINAGERGSFAGRSVCPAVTSSPRLPSRPSHHGLPAPPSSLRLHPSSFPLLALAPSAPAPMLWQLDSLNGPFHETRVLFRQH